MEDKNNYKIGLALSGGGSRAIAFHLGCMRALHKHKILEEINVISSVSGGSVINALYSYFDEDFVEFDKKIVSLLERGLKNLILKEFIFSKDLISELVILALKPLYYTLLKFGITLPLQRKHTRTTSFIKAMNKYFFYNKKIDSKRKNGINVIINATEMRTNTAFRFGNKETGCLRFGKVDNNEISVAEAVVASAAYPVLLPAIDCNYIFKNKDKVKSERVIISDGGMYDNLGVTCFYPDKDPKYSLNTYKVDYIISCNADFGTNDGDDVPFGWVQRMIASFRTAMKKNQDNAMNNLHEFKKRGMIKGFALSYLGQLDEKLPNEIPNLIDRELVNYPTNFNKMMKKDIDNLTIRGEQLTVFMLKYYLPELIKSEYE